MKHTSNKIKKEKCKKNIYISYLGVSSHSHNNEQRNVISELWVIMINPQLSLIKLIENIVLFAAVIIHLHSLARGSLAFQSNLPAQWMYTLKGAREPTISKLNI